MLRRMNIARLIANFATSRAAWLSRLLDPRRDIAKECGHPIDITIQDYHQLYERGDLGARIVDLFPMETWADVPEVYETEDSKETEFEKAWKELTTKLPVFPVLCRGDRLSGIGRFGVILLGLDDGKPLDQPLDGVEETVPDIFPASPARRKLLYLRPLSEQVATVAQIETRTISPRYGQPLLYNLQFSDSLSATAGTASSASASQSVHWSRVIHLADNRIDSEIFGEPRMKVAMNRLLDLHKVVGGSGEMFWKGGFPGLSMETIPGADEEIEFDAEAVKTQLEEYMNGLRRYIATIGMTAKSISVQVADPTPHVKVQLELIAAAIGVPLRILMGSERGELASSQDALAWGRRVARRREDYVTPYLLRPFVTRLIQAGVLPSPAEGVRVQWKDINTPSEDVRAQIMERKTTALSRYVSTGADTLMSPFHYLTLVMGMTEEEAKSIIDEAEMRVADMEEDTLTAAQDLNPAVEASRIGAEASTTVRQGGELK